MFITIFTLTERNRQGELRLIVRRTALPQFQDDVQILDFDSEDDDKDVRIVYQLQQ